jgi:hypothetical protein
MGDRLHNTDPVFVLPIGQNKEGAYER